MIGDTRTLRLLEARGHDPRRTPRVSAADARRQYRLSLATAVTGLLSHVADWDRRPRQISCPRSASLTPMATTHSLYAERLARAFGAPLCLAVGAPRGAHLPWAAAAIRRNVLLRHLDAASLLAMIPRWQPIAVTVTRPVFAELRDALVETCARAGARLVVVEPDISPEELADALHDHLPRVARR